MQTELLVQIGDLLLQLLTLFHLILRGHLVVFRQVLQLLLGIFNLLLQALADRIHRLCTRFKRRCLTCTDSFHSHSSVSFHTALLSRNAALIPAVLPPAYFHVSVECDNIYIGEQKENFTAMTYIAHYLHT